MNPAFHRCAGALCAALGIVAGTAFADVRPATAYTSIADQNGTVQSFTFGRTEAKGGISYTEIGDRAETPVLSFQVASSNTKASQPNLSASLGYYWKVVGAAGDSSPVLVHISTAGWLDGNYGFTPVLRDTYNLYPNDLRAGLAAYFYTGTPDPTTRSLQYGLQTSGLNWGVERIEAVGNFTLQNGGSSTLHGTFSKSFDLVIWPNTENYIVLQAYAFLYNNSGYVSQYANEHFKVNGFIDPVITVDAAYANRFSVISSEIPTLAPAVPEPGTFAMMACALVLLPLGMRRKARE